MLTCPVWLLFIAAIALSLASSIYTVLCVLKEAKQICCGSCLLLPNVKAFRGELCSL